MKKTFLFLMTIFLFSQAYSQKVNYKKGEVTIDKVLYVRSGPLFTSGPIIYKHRTEDKVLFTYDSYKYMSMKKEYINKTWVETPTESTSFIIKFIDLDQTMYTSMGYKEFIRSFYENKVINEDGFVNNEKAQEFMKIYGQERKY